MKRITMRISLVIVFASLFVFGVIFAGGQHRASADDVDDDVLSRTHLELISEARCCLA